MRDREIICTNYICEGNCSIGRVGKFRSYCQTCDKYNPRKGSNPARKDLRNKKLEDARKKEMYD